jgi:hypothetical protein
VVFFRNSATSIYDFYSDASLSALAAKNHLSSIGAGLQGVIDKVK